MQGNHPKRQAGDVTSASTDPLLNYLQELRSEVGRRHVRVEREHRPLDAVVAQPEEVLVDIACQADWGGFSQ